MPEIHSHKPKLEQYNLKEASNQGAESFIDPATGLPLDTLKGLASLEDTISSFPDIFASMFDLLDFKDSVLITNNPQLPAPALTKTGVLREAILKGQARQGIAADTTTKSITDSQILQTTIDTTTRTDGQRAADNSASKPNPWIQHPNSIGAMLIASIAIAKSLSEAKMSDGELNRTLTMKMYKLDMASAEELKKLQDLKASQETLQAVHNFVSAGIAVYQMASILHQKSEDKKEVEQEIAAQQTKVNNIENDLKSNTTSATDTEPQELINAKSRQEVEENLKIEKAKLAKMKENQEQMVYDTSRKNLQFNEAKFRAINEATNGIFTLMGTVMTKEQGVVEKHKAQLEALKQMLMKVRESTNSSIESYNSMIEKSLSLAERTSADLKASMSTKG